MKKIFCLLIFIVFLMPLFAQEASSNGETNYDENKIIIDDNITEEENNAAVNNGQKLLTVWDFVKVILVLVAVVIFVYAIFYFLKKSGGTKYQNNNLIKLLGSQSLTQNCTVHLIEAGEKYYLIGCSENTVSHIADIDDKESIDSLIINAPVEPTEKKGFFEIFSNNMSKKNAQGIRNRKKT